MEPLLRESKKQHSYSENSNSIHKIQVQPDQETVHLEKTLVKGGFSQQEDIEYSAYHDSSANNKLEFRQSRIAQKWKNFFGKGSLKYSKLLP